MANIGLRRAATDACVCVVHVTIVWCLLLLAQTDANSVKNATNFDARSRLGLMPAPSYPELDEISGAFAIIVVVRFDDVATGFQRILDFGNGDDAVDAIILTQQQATNNILLQVARGGTTRFCVAHNEIDEGVVTTWEAGVDDTSRMYIKKNGVEVASFANGVLPTQGVVRQSKLIGQSNLNNHNDLSGAVLDLEFVKGAQSHSGLPNEWTNFPNQLRFGTGFVLSAYIRFDNLSTNREWQRAIWMGNGQFDSSVSLGQESNTKHMAFSIHNTASEGMMLVAPNTIVEGEMSFWQAGVTDTGYAWIRKNGTIVASQAGFLLPNSNFRKKALFGYSDSPGHSPLAGVVLGARVDHQHDS